MGLGGVLTFGSRPLCWLRHESSAMTSLKLAVALDQLPRIVIDHCGNAVPRVAHSFDGWIVLRHDSVSPSSSRGVTKDGTNSPRIPLTRRMWANLLAFARCRQFHVSKKSQRWCDAIASCQASPAG